MRKSNVMWAAMVLALVGCGNQTVTTDIQKALVADDSLQVVFQNLMVAATASIPALPADKQDAARQTLADIQARGVQAFQTKEDALQAALLANQQTLDVSALVQAIVIVTEDLWTLCSSLPVSPKLLTQTQTTIGGHKAALARGDYRRR